MTLPDHQPEQIRRVMQRVVGVVSVAGVTELSMKLNGAPKCRKADN